MTLSDDQIAKYGVSYRHEIDAWCSERSPAASRITDTVRATARLALLAAVYRRTDDSPVQ